MILRVKEGKYPYAKSLSEEHIREFITETIGERNAHIITNQEYNIRMGKAMAYAEAGWLIGELSTETALDFIITIENRT